MTEQRNEPMPDDLDALLTRYLRWRSDSAAGLPTAAEMALRVTGARSIRRTAFEWRLAWAVAAVAAALAGVLVMGGGAGPRSPLGLASPTAPVVSTLAPRATRIPTPTLDDTACTSGRITFQTGVGRTPPSATRGLQAPSGGRVAIAYEEGSKSGSLVVADSIPGSARVVADFTGQQIEDVTGVRVLGWSSSGDQLLVLASHSGRDKPATEASCDNLFVVATDGSRAIAITDNGPGQRIDAATLSPGGRLVAYVRDFVLHVVNVDAVSGDPVQIPIGGCSLPPSELDWSPDEQHLAFVCGRSVAVFDNRVPTISYTAFDANGRTPMTLSWLDNGALVLAWGDDGPGIGSGPVLIVDLSAGNVARTLKIRTSTQHKTEWVLGRPSFSPDRSWLLVQGDGGVASAYFPTYLVDTHSGATTKLPWPVLTQLAQLDAPTAWLPGPRPRVIVWDSGQIVELDLVAQTRTSIGPAPAWDAVAFFPG